MNTEIRGLFCDIVYDALLNGHDYDEEILDIYDDWFSDEEDPNITWNRISEDIEERINTIILGDTFKEEKYGASYF